MSAGIYLWDLDLSPHPCPWSCIFKVRFWHSLISGIGRAIAHITKVMWVDSKLDTLHVCDHKDFQGQISKKPYVVNPLWPWPLTLNSDCQGQIFRKLYLSNGRIAWHRAKGMSLIQCWTHYANLNFDLNYNLTVNIWIFTVKFLILWNGWADWYEKRDINRWTLPMTLTLDFENNCIWEITSDITLMHGKHFLSFICYIRWW